VTEAAKGTSVNSILQEEARIGYYIYDGRGSVSQVVPGTGDLVTGYSYDPFGNMTKGGPEAGNVFGITGSPIMPWPISGTCGRDIMMRGQDGSSVRMITWGIRCQGAGNL